ncbi:MAG: nucleotidyltransferase family protein [Bacteroidota bacterium]
MPDIWAIILAAGESKRMGSPKMLLPFGGKTLIEKVIENVVSSRAGNTIVVLGSSADEILDRIEVLPVRHCYNENYSEGMLSSVKCGFSKLPEKYDAAIVLPGDYPGIGAGVINMLIESFSESSKKIVIPLFRGKRGHPILISYQLREEVMRLSPEKGLRELMEKFPVDVLEVELNDQAVLKDIDTIDDYMNELKQIT